MKNSAAASPILRPLRPVNIQGLSEAATRAEKKLKAVRSMMLAPDARKVPPVFTPSQLSALCDISKDQYNRRVAKGELPKGTMIGARRQFKLNEEREWARACHPEWARPAGAKAIVVTNAQSKGGVGKTTG